MYDINMRVLVVDDMQAMIKVVIKILNSLGINNISTANDGKEALELLDSSSFDLIISDWNMPNINGLELLKTVRADEKLKHIPFIMLTAESQKEHFLEAIKAKVTSYISKPFTAEIFKKKLNEIFK
jgi:two-component system chemotaxis response regulator CheY